MPTITFRGQVSGDTGGAIILSIAGPDHYNETYKYDCPFDEDYNLKQGRYLIYITAFTNGTFTFDVDGPITSIDPTVPDKYKDKTQESYWMQV
jgi:hypothetical protein